MRKQIYDYILWRRGRDSNPGRGSTLNGFQDRRIRPLCHLSEAAQYRVNGAKNQLKLTATTLPTLHWQFYFLELQLVQTGLRAINLVRQNQTTAYPPNLTAQRFAGW